MDGTTARPVAPPDVAVAPVPIPGFYDSPPPPATGAAQLAEQVRAVHELRGLRDALAATLAERRANFDLNNADMLLRLREESAHVEAAEMALRSLALTHYTRTREKRPTPGVEVKEYDVYTVADEAAALAWAQQSKLCLIPETLDTKAVLKIAAVTSLPFVTRETQPKVSISTDLAKVLGGAQ